MNHSTTLIAISSLVLASLILIICSWNHITYAPFFFSLKYPSNINTPPIQKDGLEIALENASMPNKTVIVSIINKAYVEPHENEYPSMFDLFLEGFWAGEDTRPLLGHLLVVAMDETAHQRCLFRGLHCYKMAAGGGDEFSGEKVYMSDEFIEMMWRRTLFLLNVLVRGYDFIFTDTDVLWLRNPFTRLTKNQRVDLQISTDIFNGNSSSEKNLINTGFYYIRSNNKTVSLFQTWYDARKNYTGMKEQDVLKSLVQQHVPSQLGINTIFLDTNYFSGFCTDSKDARTVATVHANCCRTIGAKVVDLKTVLRDWKRFKSIGNFDDHNSSSDSIYDDGNFTNNFQWSRHVSCINSWQNKTMA